MGQKAHPKSVRLGYIKDWDSKWFNVREMPALIEEDYRLRKFMKERLRLAAVSRVGIERTGKYLKVNIYTARPGIVIGKKGADVENLRELIEEATGRKTSINIMEIKRPELDAQLIAEGIALQLEKRIAFRRAMKRAIERARAAGALGIKVMVAGRLGGAEIARTEWLKDGRVPLQTFRADIDYGFTEALITMGKIGVKVWVFKKELFKKTDRDLMEEVRHIEKEKMEELAKQAQSGEEILSEMADVMPEKKIDAKPVGPDLPEDVEEKSGKEKRIPKKETKIND